MIEATGHRYPWTPARIERLISLIKLRLSARSIAAEMGAWCTSNAVIGKAYRLGLSVGQGHRSVGRKYKPRLVAPRIKPVGTPKGFMDVNAVRRIERLAASPGLPPAPVLIPGPIGGVLFLNRKPAECAWLLSATDRLPITERRCCGASVRPGAARAFCAEHDAIAVSVVPLSRGVKKLLEAA